MADGTAWEYAYYEQHQLFFALRLAPEFDVVHSHIGSGAYALSGVPGLGRRVLHTQHNPVTADMEWFVRRHPDLWFSTVSEFQCQKLRAQGATRCHVIHNGLNVSAFAFQPRGGGGLLFLGRIEREKGPDAAVRVARALGQPLVLAGPVLDGGYFDCEIKPFLDDRVSYVGTVDHGGKSELFGRADCVIMPSRCDEGFGMVSVEAMACGTPVVALANGALPEVIDTGITGFVTRDEGELAGLVARALELDRSAIRDRVASRFNMPVVAAAYHRLYSEIAASQRGAQRYRHYSEGVHRRG
jgi:glycosyltransferase involved in cell wall biosynthesis